MTPWTKKANNFRVAFRLNVLLSYCLIFFCQFQPGVAYKSVAYIISGVIERVPWHEMG